MRSDEETRERQVAERGLEGTAAQRPEQSMRGGVEVVEGEVVGWRIASSARAEEQEGGPATRVGATTCGSAEIGDVVDQAEVQI